MKGRVSHGTHQPTYPIVAGARTPIGKLSGALASPRTIELGAIAIRGRSRAGVAPDALDRLLLGQVLQVGIGGRGDAFLLRAIS